MLVFSFGVNSVEKITMLSNLFALSFSDDFWKSKSVVGVHEK